MGNFNISEAATLWQRWGLNARKNPDRDAIIHWAAGEEPYRWTFKTLLETAKKFSVRIKEAGIKPGDVCAIIMHHNPMFYPLYLGISRIGALPAILAYPNPRLHPDKFRQGIEGMSQRSGLDWILTEKSIEPLIKPLIEKQGSTIKSIFFPLEWDITSSIDEQIDAEIETASLSVNPNDAVLLQHSSGTTGLQKPVVLSHNAILNHVENLSGALKLNDSDKIVSWLPLYHDMGLIGAYHIPMAFGIPTIQIDPFEWVLAPVLMLEAITKEKATICWIPNFAFNIFADKINEEELEGISLESLRALINCSEPVRADSNKKFADRFGKYGFNPNALAAAYGMAEITLLATLTEPGKLLTELTADRNKLANGIVEIANDNSATRVCVSSGKYLNGCEIRIVDEKRNDINDDLVGEIAIKSISMFDGYRNYPEKTAEVISEGWYFSGDYGFKHQDEFFIIGRKKDIIIVAGKNIYPEDIEDAVNQAVGVIPGRVVAFGEEDQKMGTEQVSVVAETKAETESEKNLVRMNVLKSAMTVDINVHKIYLVPPRWLFKSSAGKPSRKANKERLLNGFDPQIWSR
jgi:acyl-CoA synthetase (AMP-forming)/AMP-acid ligase II